MFTAARTAARTLLVRDGASLIPSQSLPEKYTLLQLCDELFRDENLDKKGALENVLVLQSCLEQPSRLSRDPGDEDATSSIALWISRMIVPDGSILPRDDIPSDAQTTSIAQALETTQHLGHHGLICLQTLLTSRSSPSDVLDPQILLSAIAFSSSRDPWTTTSSQSAATNILLVRRRQSLTAEFISGFLLQTVIRPLFSKSKTPAITSSGRKAMPSSAPQPRDYNISDSFNPAQKPWKYSSPYSLPVFEWAVDNSSEPIMTQNWNLFIPPLLTLLDDSSTSIRSRGLTILSSFVPKMGARLLKQTGLGEVFEDAVTPTLMFLPSITPVDESIQLLDPAYGALFALGDVKWQLEGLGDGGVKLEIPPGQMKFYDGIMRRGILAGYVHANSYPGIVELLVKAIGVLAERMGVNAVKHLKDIIPILSAPLMDPFASSPRQSLTAIRALKSVILACWPRISQPVHRLTIMRALISCWENVGRSDTNLDDIKRSLKETTRLFVKCIESTQPPSANYRFKDEVAEVIKVDSSLSELFVI